MLVVVVLENVRREIRAVGLSSQTPGYLVHAEVETGLASLDQILWEREEAEDEFQKREEPKQFRVDA